VPTTDERQAAERLAHSLVSDLALDHEHKLQQARSDGDVLSALAEEIEEARVLFRQAVDRELYPVFERAVRRWAAGDGPQPGSPSSERPLLATTADAERLARAVLTDVQLFNERKLKGLREAAEVLEALQPEIEEGRTLFRQRVRHTLHDVFERAVKEWATAMAQHQVDLDATGRPSPTPPMGYTSYRPPPGAKTPSVKPPPEMARASAGSDFKWALWLIALAAAIAVAAWLLLHR
jgi:hypothetical protein